MSKIQNLSNRGWLIVGLVVALLLVPSAAIAAGRGALKLTGIEGTSANQADVTPAQQLLTTQAPLADFWQFQGQFADTSSGGTSCVQVGTPPTGDAYVVQSVEMDIGI